MPALSTDASGVPIANQSDIMEKVKPIAEKWAATGVICLEKIVARTQLVGKLTSAWRQWQRNKHWFWSYTQTIDKTLLRTHSFFMESSYFVPLTKMASTLRIHLVDHAQRWPVGFTTLLPQQKHAFDNAPTEEVQFLVARQNNSASWRAKSLKPDNILNGQGILLRRLVGRKLWEATLLTIYLLHLRTCQILISKNAHFISWVSQKIFNCHVLRVRPANRSKEMKIFGWQGLAGYVPFVYPDNFHHNKLLTNSVSDQGNPWKSPACSL